MTNLWQAAPSYAISLGMIDATSSSSYCSLSFATMSAAPNYCYLNYCHRSLVDAGLGSVAAGSNYRSNSAHQLY
jgi:hypothetical protein